MSETNTVSDPRKYVAGGRRCALRRSEWIAEWWVGTSPRNGDHSSVEGDWEDWVNMAQGILKADAEWKALTDEQRAAIEAAHERETS